MRVNADRPLELMARGLLSLLLHAHLPYVRHPEYERFFEENWLFEAITDTYLPLVQTFERLWKEGRRFRITVSLSPTLLAMMKDELLQQRYVAHMDRLIELCEKEVVRTRRYPHFQRLANLYLERFTECRRAFIEDYGLDLTTAYLDLHRAGALELMTSAATHGFLPLLRLQPTSVQAQVGVGARHFKRDMGHGAPGIWLPECGYYPGLEEVLAEHGYRYFIVDAHGIENADSRPRFGIAAPVACPNGVAAFGRDPESSQQVWSADEGYPGDPVFREYYRDVGFDLDLEYVKPYILDGHTRINTGVKYYRVTGGTRRKRPYEPERAAAKVLAFAEDFVARRVEQTARLARTMDRPPMLLAPYDAELFGHWWHEGPQWLEAVIRKVSDPASPLELVTPSDYLDRYPDLQVATPSSSSWGYEGYNEMWLNQANDWVYPHLHRAAKEFAELAGRHRREPEDSPRARALRQAARSLLLAQASDWPFIMKTGTTVEYAHRRIRDQLARFHFLVRSAEHPPVDEEKLRAFEYLDNVFPEIDYRQFAEPDGGNM